MYYVCDKEVEQNYLFIPGSDRSGCHGYAGATARMAVL